MRLEGGGREASLWWRNMHVLCRDVWFNAMPVAQWEMGNKRFSGRKFGWVGCHLDKGLAGYMTCRCLKTNLCLICVS